MATAAMGNASSIRFSSMPVAAISPVRAVLSRKTGRPRSAPAVAKVSTFRRAPGHLPISRPSARSNQVERSRAPLESGCAIVGLRRCSKCSTRKMEKRGLRFIPRWITHPHFRRRFTVLVRSWTGSESGPSLRSRRSPRALHSRFGAGGRWPDAARNAESRDHRSARRLASFWPPP
jgi:hypothetical protein